MLSKTGIHATLALAALARLAPGQYVGATQIAQEVGAPRNYLGKLLQQMALNGLLESQKGFGGGFRLAKPANTITLYDVAEPIDHVSKWNNCFLGNARCSHNSPCATHERWTKIRTMYLQFLKETTIEDIARKSTKP